MTIFSKSKLLLGLGGLLVLSLVLLLPGNALGYEEVDLGATFLGNADNGDQDQVIDSSNRLVVSYADNTDNNKLKVLYFDNNNWNAIGTESLPTQSISKPRIAAGTDGVSLLLL